MMILQDPIVITMVMLIFMCSIVVFYPRKRPVIWLFAFTLGLFLLPRAGVIINSLNLPMPVMHIISIMAISGWLFFGSKEKTFRTEYTYYFLIYAIIISLGLAVGLSRGGKYTTAFLEFFFYFITIGLFFFASETFKDRKHFMYFGTVILIIAFVIGVYGILQKYYGSSVLINHITYNSISNVARSHIDHGNMGYRRVLSSYGDPNVLAGQLVVFLGIALALIIGRKIALRYRILGLLVLSSNILCMIYTGSRAGLLAMIIVLLAVLLWRSRIALLCIPVLLVIAYHWGPELINHSVMARFQGQLVTSADVRSQFPMMAWHLLQEYPFGCGFGNMIMLEMNGTEWTFQLKSAYNVWSGFNSYWLNIFSRLGVPGIVVFVLLLWALFKYIYQKIRMIDHPVAKAIIIGSLAGFLGKAIIWLTNNTFMLPGGGLNFWFMMGMIVAGCRAFSTESQTCPYMLPNPQWYYSNPTTVNCPEALSG